MLIKETMLCCIVKQKNEIQSLKLQQKKLPAVAKKMLTEGKMPGIIVMGIYPKNKSKLSAGGMLVKR